MKILTENAGKTQVQVAVPDMQPNCLYQVEIGYHDFKCLQTEAEYQIYKETHTMSAWEILLVITIFFVVWLAGFAIGRATSY